MRRPLTIALATAATLALAAGPAAATGGTSRTVVDKVIAVSGSEGFDHNRYDFDILREALVATGLVDAVATTPHITVFAPNDRAFLRLARDLGWDGSGGEAGAFGVIAEATGYGPSDNGLLDDVLLYHVTGERLWVRDLRHERVTPLAGDPYTVRWYQFHDADTDDRNARVTFPYIVWASNGNIIPIDRVLRPIDLP